MRLSDGERFEKNTLSVVSSVRVSDQPDSVHTVACPYSPVVACAITHIVDGIVEIVVCIVDRCGLVEGTLVGRREVGHGVEFQYITN